jgi:GAF domain-containing protein
VEVTERRRAVRRSRFLAEASAALSVSLDYEATLQQIAGLAAPKLADWCIVCVQEDDGNLRHVAAAHANLDKEALVRRLDRRGPLEPAALEQLANVVGSGRGQLFPRITDDLLVAVAPDAAALEVLRALAPASGMVAPLAARGRLLGSITFAVGSGRRPYDDADLEVAEELARRCALAIDNARLYAAARQTARNLARALDDVSQREATIREQAERLRVLNEFARTVSSTLDLPRLFSLVVEEMTELVPAGAAASRNTSQKRKPINCWPRPGSTRCRGRARASDSPPPARRQTSRE